ncbi:two-component system response regulator YesN [Paenibacillus endophyticus]|uniref:Two-component system response regulator YesN n=1 Tax=Paenibacillus endophyticus TaxID=1294268 RepID=A0A7W5CDU7_9BACL|nr:response regulator [Paenibacillus endophyticus]MBB3155415.1 two-component system response regulator YesN [Paenibacillus endophyticus]
MKILIVDDEPRHRRGMLNLILSFRPEDKILVAKDGVIALELIRSEKPDMVLTDIRMPNMDGLEFLKLLQGESHKPKVVMVTAYNLFEYAQAAIHHGAYDYVLKPVDSDQVEKLLRRIEAELDMESQQHSESEALKQKLNLTLSAYRNRLLVKWLNGDLTPDELAEMDQIEGLNGKGIIVFTEIAVDPDKRRSFDSDAFLSSLKQCWSNVGEAFSFSPNTLADSFVRAITIILTPEGLTAIQRADIRTHAERLEARWIMYGQISHGIGTKCQSMQAEGAMAYRYAQTARSYSFYDCWNGVVFYDELLSPNELLSMDTEKLYKLLQSGDLDAAKEQCKVAFNNLASNGHTNPALIKESAVLTLIKLKSRSRNLVDQQIGSVLSNSAAIEVPACQSFEEILELLELRLRDVYSAIQPSQSEKDVILAEDCLRWIEEHVQEELTLERAADRFFFNPSYFSTWIKQQTGRTFSDHLVEARMRKAQSLLNANRKIYEVASACGYSDTKYFCRVFKKHHGMSPASYKHTTSQRSDMG